MSAKTVSRICAAIGLVCAWIPCGFGLQAIEIPARTCEVLSHPQEYLGKKCYYSGDFDVWRTLTVSRGASILPEGGHACRLEVQNSV